jgi:hypothetical protein
MTNNKRKPYDHLTDEDKPARLFSTPGVIPLDPEPKPMNPTKDLFQALRAGWGDDPHDDV